MWCRFILLGLYVSVLPLSMQSQILSRGVVPVEKAQIPEGNIYALIVGISDYQNPGIPDLKYADRDAQAFANYLLDPKGVGVDTQNLELLLNEKASAGNVIMSMYPLLDKIKEGDLFIFYFSGHGDLETKTLSQPGFLLCWDAPPAVYMGGGTFGLIYLQEIISTLSTQNKAKVLMVTDACRSGKLAGNAIGGSQMTSANLAKQFANELKILSCQPDELSLEGPNWGGGRGVFSYYLLKGLHGKADKNNDQMVSLFEIERYLEDEVSNAVAPQRQMPMTVGNKTSLLTKVHKSTLDEDPKINLENQSVVQSRATTGGQSQLENPKVIALYNLFSNAITEKRLIFPKDSSAWDYMAALEREPECSAYIKQWKYQMAAAMVDETQQAINDYLKSDPVELRKRWSFNERYERYPEYLEKAAAILGKEHKLYSTLQSRKHYYEGLKLRLKGERNQNKTLFESAKMLQFRCIELEPDAGFAYNELGLLERRVGRPSEAIRYFQKALSLCPRWALAWANLSACYADTKSIDSAIYSGLIAIELDSMFALAYYNLGLSYQLSQQYELAIVQLNRACRLDTTYANAYFNLSLAYYHAKNYPGAKATIEHYLKIKPNDPDALINLGEIELKLGQPQTAISIFNKVLMDHPEFPAALQSLGEYYRAIELYETSDYHFRRIADKSALIYFYLGSNAALQHKPDSATAYFKQAFDLGYHNIPDMKQDKGFMKMLHQDDFLKHLQHYFPAESFNN